MSREGGGLVSRPGGGFVFGEGESRGTFNREDSNMAGNYTQFSAESTGIDSQYQGPTVRLNKETHSNNTQSNCIGNIRNPSSLLSLDVIPEVARPVFSSNFQHFNAVQSQVVPTLLNTDFTAAVAAPTGSGKTVKLNSITLNLFLAPVKGHITLKLCVFVLNISSNIN